LTRNPLAEPGLLGINAGAALAVIVGVALFDLASMGQYLGCAFLGAGLAEKEYGDAGQARAEEGATEVLAHARQVEQRDPDDHRQRRAGVDP
ncbi:iron chelate uptake ABC transporter family permease subunit, partial [Pseudomonas aeruginosa]